jgi:hypothetical protein
MTLSRDSILSCVKTPAWIEIHWNSICLRAGHMLLHTTLEGPWPHHTTTWVWRSVGTTAFGHFSFGLSQFHGHDSWLVCEVALIKGGHAIKPTKDADIILLSVTAQSQDTSLPSNPLLPLLLFAHGHLPSLPLILLLHTAWPHRSPPSAPSNHIYGTSQHQEPISVHRCKNLHPSIDIGHMEIRPHVLAWVMFCSTYHMGGWKCTSVSF